MQAGGGRHQHRIELLLIALDHGGQREASGPLPNTGSIQSLGFDDRRGQGVNAHGLCHHTALRPDELPHGARRQRRHRGSTRHRFDGSQPEGLLPQRRRNEYLCRGDQGFQSSLVQMTHVRNILVQLWGDQRPEVFHVLDRPGQAQFHGSRPGCGDGNMRALFRGDAPGPCGRPGLGVLVAFPALQGDAVMDNVESGQPPAPCSCIGLGNRNESLQRIRGPSRGPENLNEPRERRGMQYMQGGDSAEIAVRERAQGIVQYHVIRT